VAESARILIVGFGVCLLCTCLLAAVASALWSQVQSLRADLRRYRADQRADRSRLDDLEPARGRELRRRARREAYERHLEQEQAAHGRAH
jgi:hypothetical protein